MIGKKPVKKSGKKAPAKKQSQKTEVKPNLTEQESKDLIGTLNLFARWLITKKIISELPDIENAIDLPYSTDDWTMRFNEKTREVSFNVFLKDRCSFDYYKSIIIHEFFHLAVQKVPNKEDAVKIKDDFGDELLRIIDIEADFFTALFYKEELNFSLVQFLNLFYQGSQAFSDKWIRKGKLERYMGTLLSVVKLFLTHPNKTPPVLTYDLYLPSISPLYTEENIHVLVLRKEHIYFEQVNVTVSDLLSIRKCYTNVDSLTLKGYVKEIISFVSRALNTPVPPRIENEINSLTN